MRDAERGAAVALGVGLAAQLGTAVYPYTVRVEWVLAAGCVAFISVLLASPLLRRPSWEAVAAALDRACGLEDRLLTWLSVVRGQATGRLVDHFLRDAEAAASTVRANAALPLSRPRLRAVAALALASVLWEMAASGITLPGTPAHRVAEVVRREGRRLLAAGEAWEQRSRARGLLEPQRTAQALAATGERLTGPRASAATALRELRAVQEVIEAARRPFQSALQRAGVPEGTEPWMLRPWAAAVDRELSRIASSVDEAQLPPQRAEAIRRVLRALDASAPLPSGAPARRALEEATRRLGSGDTPGAREAARRAQEALRELERLLEAEGALAAQQREAEASSTHIANALQSGADPEAAVERPHTYPAGPRDTTRSSSRTPEDPEAQVWLGPEQGTQPGAGSVRDKLGPVSPRLPHERRPEVLRGQVAEGRVYTAQIVAPAAPARARTPLQRVPVRAVRQVDEALVRDRVPARYRDWVRRYFTGLGGR